MIPRRRAFGRDMRDPERPRPRRQRTTSIVVHHFGVEPLTPEGMRAFFLEDPEGVATVTLSGTYASKLPTIRSWRQRGVPEHRRAQAFVPYHFAVAPDGRVAQFLDLDAVGAHAAGANDRSVAVALLGTFDHEPPSDEQHAALRRLLRTLVAFYPRVVVEGHDDVNRRVLRVEKGCPGAHVDLAGIRAWLDEQRCEEAAS